jgi:hypothetical protein
MGTSAELADTVNSTNPADLAAAITKMPQNDRKEMCRQILNAIPPGEAEEVAKNLLPQAPKNIWYVLLIGLLGLAIVFGGLAFVLILTDRDAAAVIALATGALGGAIGLLSPTPLPRR